jgi:hypothetical protein
MNSRVMKSLVVAVALAAGVSGIAHADDSSMNPFSGESYAYFNGGDLPYSGKTVFDKAPSAFRATHPNGLSDRQLEALSSEALASDFTTPTLDKAPSEWRIANPNGLSERQYQALSSEAPVWHEMIQSAPSALASTNGAVVASTTVK